MFCLNNPIQVDIHDNIERIVDISPNKRQNQLKYLCRNVELHLADINPLKSRLQVHSLCFWQNQLPVEHSDPKSLQIDLVEKLHNYLEHTGDPGQNFLFSTYVLSSTKELREDQI